MESQSSSHVVLRYKRASINCNRWLFSGIVCPSLKSCWHEFWVSAETKICQSKRTKRNIGFGRTFLTYIRELSNVDASLFAREISEAVFVSFHFFYTKIRIEQMLREHLRLTVTDLKRVAFEHIKEIVFQVNIKNIETNIFDIFLWAHRSMLCEL